MAVRWKSTFPAPSAPGYAVERRPVSECIEVATARKVTLIVAPAGYGKSVALAHWATSCTRPVSWLSLTAADNDSATFAARLRAALMCFRTAVKAHAARTTSDPALQVHDGTSQFIGAAFDMAEHSVLILDEFDTLTDEGVRRSFRQFVEDAPPELHVVIASRREPDLDLHRLRLQGDLAEVRTAQLAFDAEATRTVLETVAERQLTDEQLQSLVAVTQGWAAAIRLTALSLRNHDVAVGDVVAQAERNDPQIAAYLTSEVLNQLAPEVRAFLDDTSVLDVVNGPLADAVTGRNDGLQMLALLEQQGLLTSRVDVAGDWIRYHPMLRQYLHHQLRTLAHGREDELLGRAANWYRDRGDADHAADYFIRKQDWPAVIDLLGSWGRETFEQGRAEDALRWLEAIPESVRRANVDVTLQEAVLNTMAGRTVVAEEIVAGLDRDAELSLGHRAAVEALRSSWVMFHASPQSVLDATDKLSHILDQLGSVAAGVRARRAGDGARYVPDLFGLGTPKDLAMQAAVSRACALWFMGEIAMARRDLRGLVRDTSSYAPWLVNSLSLLALVEAIDGELQAAEHYAERAFTTAADAGLRWHPSSVHAHLAVAHVHRERNQLPEADVALSRANMTIGPYRRMPAQAIAVAEEGLVHLADGEPLRGLDEITKFRTGGGTAPSGLVRDLLSSAEARVLIAAGNASEAVIVAEPTEASQPIVRAVAIQAAITTDDVALARKYFYDWQVSEGSTRGERVLRELSAALVDDLDGNRRSSLEHMAAAVAMAEADGLIRTFLDAGPRAIRLIRSLFNREPTPYLRALVEQYRVVRPMSAGHARSVVPLTERELGVLRYLPTRLTNAEIAERLYVSSNTLKSHLRSIYRKMGVAGRREAVEEAERIGLA